MRKKTVMDPAFLIVKYSVTFSEDYRASEYAQITLMKDRQTVRENVIAPGRALEIIDENSMEEVLNNEYGRVWELPTVPFRKRFKGKYLGFEN
jgi:hypothetical protein